jgi:hypothetical protein
MINPVYLSWYSKNSSDPQDRAKDHPQNAERKKRGCLSHASVPRTVCRPSHQKHGKRRDKIAIANTNLTIRISALSSVCERQAMRGFTAGGALIPL